MRRTIPTLVFLVGLSGVSVLATGFWHNLVVTPSVYDPAHSYLVASAWISGIGCPTNQAFDDDTYPYGQSSPITDPACVTGDYDKKVEGLLLAKTGSTYNNASAGATVTGVYNKYLSEVGYDLRKPVDVAPNASDPRGSHCGAGAPRFNITTKNGNNYFLACNSPSATATIGGPDGGWIRMRWGTGVDGSVQAYNATNGYAFESITDRIKSIEIIFDEGQDGFAGPDRFGVAILDNINVNGLVAGNREVKHWWGWNWYWGW